MTPFDRPPAGLTRTGKPRSIGLDVARAVALIGVVVMNYHGMINFSGQSIRRTSLIDRIFDIGTGVLSTRFAATFVVIAGVGVTLLTERSRTSGSAAALQDDRLRLLRRGSVLLIGGYFLDLVWPGTILFYYGVYFVAAAFVFHLRTRALIAIGMSVSIAAVGVSTWRRDRLLEGDPTRWVDPSDITSVQDLAARIFLGYTHPLLPWFAFFLAGLILGRHVEDVRKYFARIAWMLLAAIVAMYSLATAVRSFDVADSAMLYISTSMQPDERGATFIVSTLALALLAFVLISRLAELHRSNALVTVLQRAGQLSLTLYLGHVLFFYVVYDWIGWNSGLGWALLLAALYWSLAIAVGSWWHHRIGAGPVERLYRLLGG